MPVAAATITLMATEVAPEWIRRWLLLPLSLLLIIEFSAINNRQYYAGQWRTERDKLVASQIVHQIRALSPAEKTYRIAVVGAGPAFNDVIVPIVPTSSLAWSIFEITGGNPRRIANYLGLVSHAKFHPAVPEQYEKSIIFAAAMPLWPKPGSIALMGDVVVIKFGDPTALQVRHACLSRQSEFCSRR